jgi:hypothetical protein
MLVFNRKNMASPLGPALITLGLILFFGAWFTGSSTFFMLQLIIGPVLISIGWQLL